MAALLEALRPRVSRRSIAAAAAALVLVTAVSAVLAAQWSWRRSLCESPNARVEQFWGPAVRSAAEAAFQKSDAPYARDVWRTTSKVVDNWFGRWAAAYEGACAEVRQTGRAEGAAWEKLSCLDNELEHVAGTTSLMARASGAVISRAAILVDGLHAGPGCEGRSAAIRLQRPLDPQRRLRQIELRARLDEPTARAWLELAQAVGYWRADVAGGQELIEAARVAIARAALAPGELDVTPITARPF